MILLGLSFTLISSAENLSSPSTKKDLDINNNISDFYDPASKLLTGTLTSKLDYADRSMSDTLKNGYYNVIPASAGVNGQYEWFYDFSNQLISTSRFGQYRATFGIEYRQDQEGYIIYDTKNKERLLGVVDDEVIFEEQEYYVNSQTHIRADFLWDITVESNKSGEFVFSVNNRRTKEYITNPSTLGQSDPYTLSYYYTLEDNGFFFRSNSGYYKIYQKFPNKELSDDLPFVLSLPDTDDGDVVFYPNENSYYDQFWYSLYIPEQGAYIIGDRDNVDRILTSPEINDDEDSHFTMSTVDFSEEIREDSLYFFSTNRDGDQLIWLNQP